jgi:chromosome partitioning protein
MRRLEDERMAARTILILNTKGGVGKTTLSTNLASYYASCGARVGLVDMDRQRSSSRWLEDRPKARPAIAGFAGWNYPALDKFDWLIMDAPAALERKELARLVLRADVTVVPLLPSPVDIAAAVGFLRELLLETRIRASGRALGVVANRVQSNTLAGDRLRKFLSCLDIPCVAQLRDTQNYNHAAADGLGIFDLDPAVVRRDLGEWQPLLAWISERARSPATKGGRPQLRAVPA